MDIKINMSADGWQPYVPVFRGNRDVAADKAQHDQISMDIRWLSNGQQKRYAEMVKVETKGRRLVTNSAVIEKRIFVENVRNLKNIKFDGKEVTDPEMLYDLGPKELIDEICEAIQRYGALSEDDIKN